MLLLADKSIISNINKLSEVQQKNLILQYAKSEKRIIYFGLRKKNQTDKQNFHFLTEDGHLIQRIEFISYFKNKKYIFWSLYNNKCKKRIYGDLGTIVYEFNKLI